MARGGPGAFGGTKINSYPVWLGFCAAFLLGLVDWRRLFSLRNLDLLVLLSFSVSLWFFNHGNIFAAMPLVYPGLVWLLARCLWIGSATGAPRGSTVWPVWLLVGATVFLAGFRIGLNVRASNVIDVGYSGVIGAERIAHGQSPYGNFPIEGDRPACGPADSTGEIRDRIQTNGRCEAADAQGDTYGPVSYEAYLPGYWSFGWSGKWDTLPAAHATSILWDLLCLARPLARRPALRRRAARGDARLRLGRVAVLAVRLELEHERHDPAGAADLRLLLPDLAVRCAAPSALSARSSSSRRCSCCRSGPATPTRATAARAGGSSSAPSSPPRRRSRSCCSSRARCTARGCSSTTRSATSSAAPRRSRSGTGASTTRRGIPDLHSLQRVLEAGARRRRARALPLAAAPLAAPDRRVHRRAARRLRARADALVLPLPAVVLPLRRVRGARCRARPRRRFPSPRRKPSDEDPVPSRLAVDSAVTSPDAASHLPRDADSSQLVARPSAPHSTSAPSIRTSPVAGSSRTGHPGRRTGGSGPSGTLPITESCGPVIPASVIAAVPPASTRASFVCTCVCVPSTAVTRPSR